MTATYPDNRREQYLDKPLPSSEESERVILGMVQIDNRVMAQCAEVLKPEDFYSPLNKRIYAAMLVLFAAKKNIEPILIGEEMKKEGSLESIGGITVITNLTLGLPYISDVGEYIKVVKEKKQRRDLIRTCNAITSEALAEETDNETLINSAEAQMFKVCEMPHQAQTELLGDLVRESLQETEEMMERGVQVVGVPSGLKDLDDLTGGWQKGDLILLAARPSMGKSSASVGFGKEAATDEMVVAYFTLEDKAKATVARIITAQARINLQAYRQAKLSKMDMSNAKDTFRHLGYKKMFIVDAPHLTPMQLRAKCQRIYSEHKRLDLVVVDYLQMMTPSAKGESRVQDVSQISRELKQVARELDVPLIALSQLSRGPEARNPPRPIMSDLRDSGSLEQDADVVIFIYRDEYYNATSENENVAEFIVAKQRNGPTGTVKTAFLKQYVKFENYHDGSDDYRQQSLVN